MKEETKQVLKNAAIGIAFLAISIGVLGVCSYRLNTEKASDPTGGLSGGLTVNAGEENGAISLFAAGDVVTNDNGTESTTINVETVYPSEVVIDFSLAWSGSADWSSGKEVSAYVTATPAEDTRSVTLTCLAAFGDQIVLTATVSGTNNSATATVDYLRKVKGMNYTVASVNKYSYAFMVDKQSITKESKLPAAKNYNSFSSDSSTFSIYNTFLSEDYGTVVSYEEGNYTLDNGYSGIEINIRVSEEYVTAAQSVGLSVIRDWKTVLLKNSGEKTPYYNTVCEVLLSDWLDEYDDGCPTGEYKKMLQALALTTGYDLEVSIGATFEHGGFKSTVYKVHFSHTSSDMLSAMALSNNSIIFNA